MSPIEKVIMHLRCKNIDVKKVLPRVELMKRLMESKTRKMDMLSGTPSKKNPLL